jgi:hypothetical protein
MTSEYDAWLRAQGYDSGTVRSQMHRVGRVEQYVGDLDRHFAHDRLDGVLETLRYSTEDERRGRPNPTRIPINGTLRTNLGSYRNAVALYRKFLDGETIEKRPSAYGTPAALNSSLGPPHPTARPPLLAAALSVPHEHARTLAEFGFDGQAALTALIAASRYRTVAQAVASLALFSHPETVVQTGGRAIFPTIRGVPGQYAEVGGRALMFDDNKSPTDAFLWANAINRRGRDTQFNHVYAASADADSYTALPNIVMTPAFMAKLTDTSAEVKGLLAWRSYDLYGWAPAGSATPERPDSYAALKWAPPLPAVPDLKSRLEAVMARRPKDRTVSAARRLGWLFGKPAPALSVPAPQEPVL